MDNQDSHYSFLRVSSRGNAQSDFWPSELTPDRNQGASTLGRYDSARLIGQSDPEPQASSSFQTNSNTFQSNSDTSTIWAQPTTRWNTTETGHSLRRAGTSPAPSRMNGTTDHSSNPVNGSQSQFAPTQQGTPYMGGRARNSITSLGLPPPSRPEFSSNESSDTVLMRHFDALSFNQNPFDAPSGSASAAGSVASATVPSGSAGLPNGTTASSFSQAYSYATAAPTYPGHSQRANLQSATAFSSPGSGANAVPHHRNSLTDNSAPPSVIMPTQSIDSSYDPMASYGLNLSTYPQATGSAAFQLNPGSAAWDSVNPQTNGAAGYLQSRGFATNAQHQAQPSVDQFNYAQNSLSFQQQVQRGYNASNTAALLNRGQPAQVGLGNQLPNFLGRDNDSQSIALRAAFPQSRQVPANSFDTLTAASFLAAGRPAVTPQYFQEQLLQGQNLLIPAALPLQHAGLQFSNPMMHTNAANSLRDRDPSRSLRSPLLKDFLESKGNRNFELLDIVGHVVEFSGDQHGSRFIQTKLETANKDVKDIIFGEMADNIVPLTKDVFGNYVIQKFLEHGSQKQKEYIAEKMKGRMVDLSTQCYSCRVVQRVMQNSLLEQKIALAKELDGHILRVVKDNSGNHVVQKVMEEINRSELDFLVDALRTKVIDLSTHNYGCRIIQKLHEVGSNEDRAMIVSEVKGHVQELSMGQFGNYVIQKIIQGNSPEHRSTIINAVINKLIPMCKQKFASNVVEACIKNGSQDERHRILEELNKVDSNDGSVLHQLANDMFGNYVLQKLLHSLEGDDQRQFAESLAAQVDLHRKSGSSRPNAAIDRLAETIEGIEKANKKAESTKAADSPNLGSAHGGESTPPLTEAPNSPESSNPPSVRSGPTETVVAKSGESLAAGPAIALPSDE
ncbi:pumilio domain-containing protein [Ophiostoma piceae UAMH 11346]|uniref:Pumilio domain-containing protein n=1 Tax=Ophiostoma piceae (strain UAMH 11346) TaxID=1262450 RepID=S3C9E7_OPHP1|nr:pumilio domain-containing protein [Ophiostoma piceae UAMH 11346]